MDSMGTTEKIRRSMSLWVYKSMGLWVYRSIGLWVHESINLLKQLIDLLTYRLVDLFCVLCLVSCVLCLVPSSRADLDMHILPGLDSYYKHGRWLPLRLTLASVDEDTAGGPFTSFEGMATVEIQDSTAGTRQTYSVPAVLSRATRKVQYLYVLPESFRRNLHVRLIDNYGKEALRKDAPLVTVSPDDLLIVVVARSGGGLEFLAEHSQTEPVLESPRTRASGGITAPQLNQGKPESREAGKPERKVHVSYLTAGILPDRWKGYDSVDMIVLGDASLDALSADQRRAITDWVYGGGRLAVSGGAHSQNLLGTFVEELLPVRINGTRVLDSMSSLSGQFGGDISGTRMVVTSSELTDRGRAMAAEDDGLPIIAEKEAGDGRVTFLAFDYLDPAFRAWSRKREMWERILPQPTVRKYPKDTHIARLLSTARSVRLPSYRVVGFFLLLYISCFGPLNYLILKRSNRGEWMWITMPAIAAAFTIGSLGFTYATRSRAAVVNDLSVLDVYQDMGRARITSYFGLFFPAKADYTIEFPASEAVFVNRMQSPDRKIRQDVDCRLVEKEIFQMEVLRMKTLSPQLFRGESYVDLSGSISISLSEDSEGVAHGEVISGLPFDLTDCYVFSNGRQAYVGDLTRGTHTQARLDRPYSGNIPGIYFTRGGEKQQFINAMSPSLSRPDLSTGVIGWMDGSMLKTLVGMSMGEEYKALGMALVIVHL
jgi:hypothetical protein